MSRLAIAWLGARMAILAIGVGVLAWFGWDEWVKLLRTQPVGIDFMPMWSAGREAFGHFERVYDVSRLTRFEHPMLAGFPGPRPFVYPPTALLLFAPLATAPFGLANALWTLAGAVALVAALAPALKSTRWLLLIAMLLTPAAVLVEITGQVTFLIAALALTALAGLERRPVLAGVLFGVAGVLKPQSMVLLPVALLALGAWRAMAATAVTASAAALAATFTFGLKAWLAWAHALASFDHWVMSALALQKGMVTPTALGISLKFDPGAMDVWRLAFDLGAVAIVWHVFRRTDDLARRSAALLGGSLFITPYAMHYDGALLAPAAALMLAGRPSPGAWSAAVVASGVLCFAAIPHWGAAAVTAFTLFAALTSASAFGGQWRLAEFAGRRLTDPGFERVQQMVGAE